MQRAKKIDYPVWGPDDLEVNESWIGLKGSPTRVVKITNPKVARSGEMFAVKNPEDVETAAEKFVDYLKQCSL